VRAVLADGTMVEDNSGPRGVRVLNAAVADWTTDLLTSVVQPGATGYRANIGRPAAGKTGSAEHNTAAWFVGYTPQLTTAIWMGYTDKLRTINVRNFAPVFGGTIPAITWHDYMSAAMAGQPEIPFPTPGILPAPTSGIRKAERQTFPNLVQDCGGPCMNLPQLTTPPTTEPPPPEDTVPVTVPETTPGPTEPPTTGPPGTGGEGFTSSSTTSSSTRSRGR
jgi:membrane peptidoglycan carboxypeptidase